MHSIVKRQALAANRTKPHIALGEYIPGWVVYYPEPVVRTAAERQLYLAALVFARKQNERRHGT